MNENAHHGAVAHDRLEDHQAVDPVCGMAVDPASALSHTYEGREYFFCSEHCRDRFKADPAKCINTSPQADAPSQHVGHHHEASATATRKAETRPLSEQPEPSDAPVTVYTCPMHPQIRRTSPGNC